MSIKFTEADREMLDRMIEGILLAFDDEEVSLSQATAVIAHIVTAAATSIEMEVRDWLDPTRLVHWKEECRAEGS